MKAEIMKWRWMPGMKTKNGARVTNVYDDGYVEAFLGGYVEGPLKAQMLKVDEDCEPDCGDSATMGCFLAQVRWRHGAECSTEYRTRRGWRVVRPVGAEATVVITKWHTTEAQALLAALEGKGDGCHHHTEEAGDEG